MEGQCAARHHWRSSAATASVRELQHPERAEPSLLTLWSRRYLALVSFDLYFVSLGTGETFEDAMGRLEEAAAEEAELTSLDVQRWESVLTHVQPLLPDAEEFVGDSHRELSDDETGMQLSMSPGELSLTVPYWYDGPEAREMSRRLRSVTVAVEAATGLIAYDPQADAPFIGAGEQTAAETFDQVHAAFMPAPEPTAPVADSATSKPGRRRLFRRDR